MSKMSAHKIVFLSLKALMRCLTRNRCSTKQAVLILIGSTEVFLFMIDTNEKRFRKKMGDVLKRQQSDQRDENNRSPQKDPQHIEKCPQPWCPFKSFIT